MRPRFISRLGSAAIIGAVISFGSLTAAGTAWAQGTTPAVPQSPRPPAITLNPDQDAKRLREQFLVVLKQYPPGLGRLLKLDPSLFSNEPFMAPYPALSAFVNQHPEVKRNTSYFLESIDAYYGGYQRSESNELFRSLVGDIGALIIFVIVVSALGWTVRTFIDYRRWNRLSKTQSEAHAKLLDRFTANDELIAYVKSDAGQKFLESAPIALDSGPRSISAPFSRILWSVQVGLVAAAGGLGLRYVSAKMADDFTSGRVSEDLSQPLYILGVFALSIGVGFVISALVSYFLSRRLGLLNGTGAGTPANRTEIPRSEA
jgi:hypothetical protein